MNENDELGEYLLALNQGFADAGESLKTIFGDAVGGAENALSMGTSMGGEVLGGINALGAAIDPTQENPNYQEIVDDTRNAVTYEPRTQSGQEGQRYMGAQMTKIGELAEPVTSPIKDFVQSGADYAGNIHPALGAAASAMPAAAEMMAGGPLLRSKRGIEMSKEDLIGASEAYNSLKNTLGVTDEVMFESILDQSLLDDLLSGADEVRQKRDFGFADKEVEGPEHSVMDQGDLDDLFAGEAEDSIFEKPFDQWTDADWKESIVDEPPKEVVSKDTYDYPKMTDAARKQNDNVKIRPGQGPHLDIRENVYKEEVMATGNKRMINFDIINHGDEIKLNQVKVPDDEHGTGSGSYFTKKVFDKAGVDFDKVKKFKLSNIIEEDTIAELEEGIPIDKTTMGKYVKNVLKAYGKKPGKWSETELARPRPDQLHYEVTVEEK